MREDEQVGPEPEDLLASRVMSRDVRQSPLEIVLAITRDKACWDG